MASTHTERLKGGARLGGGILAVALIAGSAFALTKASQDKITQEEVAPVTDAVVTETLGAEPEKTGTSKEELLERWNKLTQEEQERMKSRYKALNEVAPKQREQIINDASRLMRLERRIQRSLTDEERQAFESLSGEEGRQIMREMVLEEAREEGRSLIEKLDPKQRQMFREASPETRSSYMSRLRLRQEKQLGSALRELAIELELPQDHVNGLQSLPPERRTAALLEFIRRGIHDRIVAKGLKDTIPDSIWKRLKTMPPGDFLHAMKRMRNKLPELWPSGKGAPTSNPSETDLSSMQRRQLMDALRPRTADRLELARMGPGERERVMADRCRQRVTKVLEEISALEQAELESWRKLTVREFYEHVRERFHTPNRWGPRVNGRGPGEGGSGNHGRGGASPGRNRPSEANRLPGKSETGIKPETKEGSYMRSPKSNGRSAPHYRRAPAAPGAPTGPLSQTIARSGIA
ncbi:MAG: iron-sulfur cluster repair protein YtfE (RIC family) [Planctomycetota bacterium]|jgi:iron-sulfur cluster repair protein YtfE (RIC family)